MTKEERHELILETLIKHESVQVSDLSSLLAVSTVTILSQPRKGYPDKSIYQQPFGKREREDSHRREEHDRQDCSGNDNQG